MTNELRNVHVAFLVANEGIEEVELTQPWRAIIDAGGTADLIAPQPGMAETIATWTGPTASRSTC